MLSLYTHTRVFPGYLQYFLLGIVYLGLAHFVFKLAFLGLFCDLLIYSDVLILYHMEGWQTYVPVLLGSSSHI